MIGTIRTQMMFSLFLILHGALYVRVAVAQEKVAEGEYQMHGISETGTSFVKSVTHWGLYSNGASGYRLESEIQNLPAAIRVVQIEKLDNKLRPMEIGYELYREGRSAAAIVIDCRLILEAISCDGRSGATRFGASEPYPYRGAFWLWVEGSPALDLLWLFGGAINMTHPRDGKDEIATVIVSGGSAKLIADAINIAQLANGTGSLSAPGAGKEGDWEIHSEEKTELELLGTEDLVVGGAKISTKHYLLKADDPKNLWVAGNGIVVKADEFVLANYRQSRKFIPEIPTEVLGTAK